MKRVLVTGANKGIGLAIVKSILEEQEEVFVYLGSRSPERGAAARQGLLDENPDWAGRVEVLELDVSSDASVRAAADAVDELYAVVNNAGVGLGNSDLGAVLAVNTYGVQRVCDAFLPKLQSEGGRIVNITSASGPNFVSRCSAERQRFFVDPAVTKEGVAQLLEECLGLEDGSAFEAAGLGDGDAYGLSKAATNALTLAYARENPSLRINACTPGFIHTDLTAPYAEARGVSPEEMGMKPPAAGARSPMFLLFGEPEGNGRYYGSDAVRSPMHKYRSPGDPPYTGD